MRGEFIKRSLRLADQRGIGRPRASSVRYCFLIHASSWRPAHRSAKSLRQRRALGGRDCDPQPRTPARAIAHALARLDILNTPDRRAGRRDHWATIAAVCCFPHLARRDQRQLRSARPRTSCELSR